MHASLRSFVASSLQRITCRTFNHFLCIVLAAGWLVTSSCAQGTAPVNSAGIAPVIAVDHGPNAPQQMAKPYVILVSLDGFRYDYAKKYHADHLLALAAQGASAPEGMLPAYPSITFPNHYTIVTGLYPDHHGIVSNVIDDRTFPERFTMSADTAKDPRWWGGEPVWITAMRQGRRTASTSWPGSEVIGRLPTY